MDEEHENLPPGALLVYRKQGIDEDRQAEKMHSQGVGGLGFGAAEGIAVITAVVLSLAAIIVSIFALIEIILR